MITKTRLIRYCLCYLIIQISVGLNSLSAQCYIPFSRPDCLLDVEKSLPEVLEEYSFHNKQRVGHQKDNQIYVQHNRSLIDLLSDPRVGGYLDSLFELSVTAIAQELGSAYMCEHVEFDGSNFRVQRGGKDEAYKGKFTFLVYPSGKTCWNTPHRYLAFEFSIPLKAMVKWAPLFDNIDTSYLKPRRASRENEAYTSVIEALRARGYFHRLGRYKLLEREGEIVGFRDWSNPFLNQSVSFENTKDEASQIQNQNRPKYPFNLDTAGRLEVDSNAIIVDATPVSMDVLRTASNEIDKYYTFKIHSAIGFELPDSTVSVVQRDWDNGTTTSHGPTPIYVGKRSLGVLTSFTDVRRAYFSSTQAESGHHDLHSFSAWHPSMYSDVFGSVYDSLKYLHPNYSIADFPRRIPSAVEDSLRAIGKPPSNLGSTMVQYASPNRVTLTERDTVFSLNFGAFSTDFQTRLFSHQVTFEYDTVYFGANIISSGRFNLKRSDFVCDYEDVFVTQLLTAYNYSVNDVAPNRFQVTIEATRKNDLHVLLNEYSWSTQHGPVNLIRAEIDFDFSKKLPDSLLWIVQHDTSFQSSYMNPAGVVKPFAAVVNVNEVLRTRRGWGNYYVDESFSPSIDSLSSYAVRAGDTLTIWGKHLKAQDKIYFTGANNIEGYTYKRFYSIPASYVVRESSSKMVIRVPVSGKSIYSDLGTFELCSGYLKVGFQGFSPKPLVVP